MVILASKSPRRQELLKVIYQSFEVRPALCDEESDEKDPALYAEAIARKKAGAVQKGAGDTVIAADTVVYLDGRILGKPKDAHEAKSMLRMLSSRTHEVYSGVAVLHGGSLRSFCERTSVTFARLTGAQIERYVKSGEPMDKAGAYGIQGAGALLVRSIEGDFYNVMGLPLHALNNLLSDMGAI